MLDERLHLGIKVLEVGVRHYGRIYVIISRMERIETQIGCLLMVMKLFGGQDFPNRTPHSSLLSLIALCRRGGEKESLSFNLSSSL